MAAHKVQKRNGAIVDFDSAKIEKAIFSAAKAAGGKDFDEAKNLTAKVVAELEKVDTVPTVEEVQDLVERVLIHAGHPTTAKTYILYREKRAEQRADRNVVVEVEKTMDEYLNQLDWRVNANSNQGYSLGGMILNTAGKVTANYWLSHIYPKNVGDAHRNGDYHIHDLDMFSGYCAGWSLRALLEEGFNGLGGKTESHPPKHLSSAVSQMVNFLGSLQNEWAGAQAFSSFDTYMAPFVKKYSLEVEESLEKTGAQFETPEARQSYVDRRTYNYVYQNIQSFVFNLNVPSRWGTQTPFTNITLDWVCPEDLREKRLLLGGEPFEHKFSELDKEMGIINRAFIAVMTAGDSKGRVFTFPIPTYNITPDFDWDGENTDMLFEMTAKYGMPYFQNFINSDLKPSDVRSMCCRLQLDLNELRKRGNGLFGSAEMTGSIGVVTINSARIGYLAKGDKQKLLDRVGHLMELAKTSLEMKREEIQKWIDRGLFPFTKRYLGTLKNHFSTIGVNGVNECVRNFSDDKFDIASKEGKELALEILGYMRKKLTEFQNETGNLYNLEATPAEGTTYRFAKEDRKRYPDILQSGTEEAPYYTNSSQLPVEYTDDAFEALTHQDELQKMYTGGTVLHLYMGERISDSAACKNLVRKTLTNFRLPYITITPTFSICPKHGYLAGEHDFCPLCDEEIGYDGMDRDEKMRAPYVSASAKKEAANRG
ncbi:ribonucleoside triphosphate reductase [Candidatus Gracilibacteria bacterium]|nr:ribonucleoside triphosphate reductase [Candidatus Gracilibacteria bacterium]MCF7856222.1 ribonucleoside triphosphate reductase [Candidatus Gracilibacteria bacterium]MCF7896713.1 ribonucleoside triphosphate reductase [Candidatus Gracilibacteria bacterium]